jgi:sec-independent protein translocase protein TatB
MFDLDFGKLVVIGIIALIAIGPKELPAVLRTVGQWMTKVRRMAAEFQGQFQEAMREAEMADMKKHMDEINDAAKGLTSSFDPMAAAHTEVRRAAEDKPAAAAASGDGQVPAAAASPPSTVPADLSPLPVDLPPVPPVAQTDLADVQAHPGPAAPETRDRPS